MNGEMKHPFVRRLENSYDLGVLKTMPLDERQRFTQVTRSLAIPVSMLMHAGQDQVERNGRILKSFAKSIERLATFKVHEDQHLDLIKFDSALLFQRGVNDIDDATGHVALVPPTSLDSVPSKRVFLGFLHKLIRDCVLHAQAGNPKSRRFLASYLLSKRGWPELCAKKRLETVADHQKYLSAEPARVCEELLEEIRKAAKAVFRNTTLKKLSPSRNASYLHSRKQGGAWSEVVLDTPNPPTWTEEVPLKTVHKAFEGMRVHQGVVGGLPSADGEKVRPSIRDYNLSVLHWRNELWSSLESKMDRRLEYRLVRAQVIPEPGKFRMITAGDGTQYTWLQPLQGALLGNWAVTSFSTMKPDWEEEVAGWTAPDGWVWNSGDYKAATDQLNMRSTTEAFSEVSRIFDLPPDFDSGLDGVEVEYSAKDAGPDLPRSIWQSNGQLMGHPLSFPLLCVINLAGLKAALRRAIQVGLITKEERTLILSMTKINGDDILFPCPKGVCRIWEETARELGLVLSTGKSYASEDFAMVNNTMFDKRKTTQGGRIGYLNQKLILNFSLKSGESVQSPLEIGHAFNNMFRDCPEATTFLADCARNRRELPIYGYQPNFFVSCSLGGLGVNPAFADKPVYVTGVQRQVATLFSEGILNSFLFSQGIADRGLLGRLLKAMPRVRVSTSANVRVINQGVVQAYHRFNEDRVLLGEQFAIWPLEEEFPTELFDHLPLRKMGTFELDSDKTSYSKIVGLLSQFQTLTEKVPKRLKLKLLRDVRPMSTEKCLSLNPQMVFPQLPRLESLQKLRYRARESSEEEVFSPQRRKPEENRKISSRPISAFNMKWDAMRTLAALSGRLEGFMRLEELQRSAIKEERRLSFRHV